MPAITELNSSPYWDDYSPEEKDFLRILFRPGYSVQARELNQLQSILQEQVTRFGSHIFAEGSIVVGGQTTIDVTAKYLAIEELSPLGGTVALSGFLNKVVTGATSGAQGYVKVIVEKVGSDPKTLIYTALNGIEFTAGENLLVGGVPVATLKSTSFNGGSSTVSISSGVFYTKGIFVINEEQTTYLDKYSSTPDKIAGLTSTVVTVTSDDDDSLLDNAIGSYNYAAPGAHRLKINLALVSNDLGFTTDADKFINLLEVRGGLLYKQIDRPTYSEILRLLARRTYDESGDYTVNQIGRAHV